MESKLSRRYRERERFEFIIQMITSLASGLGPIDEDAIDGIIQSAIATANKVYSNEPNSSQDNNVMDRDRT